MGYFGIDFGTTNTAVVNSYIVNGEEHFDNYGEGASPFSSVVGISNINNSVLVGDEASNANDVYHIFRSFKSQLHDKESRWTVNNKEYSAIDITEAYFRGIRNNVNAKLKHDNFNSAVIAVPVGSSPAQRHNMIIAADRAGISVKKLVNESTAAYIGCRQELVGATYVAIIDWGGGTADISIIKNEGSKVEELAIRGTKIGGDDIDKEIAIKFHSEQAKEHKLCEFDEIPENTINYLLGRSAQAKIKLSDNDDTRMILFNYLGLNTATYLLNIDTLNGIIKPFIDEILDMFEKTVIEAGLTLESLDAVVVVGGSANIRLFKEQINERYAKKGVFVHYPKKPDWIVAHGANIIAKDESTYILNNDFGIRMSDNTFFPIFNKGMTIPGESKTLHFGVVDNSTEANFIFEKKDDDKREIVDIVTLPIKGFIAEGIKVDTTVGMDMIVNAEMVSTNMPLKGVKCSISGLKFTFDLAGKKNVPHAADLDWADSVNILQ